MHSLGEIFGLDFGLGSSSTDGLEPSRDFKTKTTSLAFRSGTLCIPVNGSRSFIECLLRNTQMPFWLFTACREVMGLRASTAPGAYIVAREVRICNACIALEVDAEFRQLHDSVRGRR